MNLITVCWGGGVLDVKYENHREPSFTICWNQRFRVHFEGLVGFK